MDDSSGISSSKHTSISVTLVPIADSEDVLILKDLPDVHEPSLDPRVDLSIRPTQDDLDLSLSQQLSRLVSHQHQDKCRQHPQDTSYDLEKSSTFSQESEPLYIEFKEGDPRNPINYPRRKKWIITVIACFSTLMASSTASAYNMGFSSMTRDLNATEFEATIGLSLYCLGFGVVPLVTASFSEELGRRPLYFGSMIGFLLMYIMVALANNIHTVQVARFIQGACGSTGATMVGGTVADIWSPNERGLPMSLFALMAVGGNGFGPLIGGWIELNDNLEWKWIQWIQLMICGICFLLLPFMSETRSSIILMRIAKKMRKDTGDKRYRARVEDERASLKTLIWISCTRPLYLMFTESIVASFSLWIGFAWGVTYCMVESIGSVFRDLHGFNIGQIGTVFLTMSIGCIIGFCSNFYQEYLYHKYYSTRGVEARLYSACFAAILLPAGMFIYAWSSFASVHWIALAIGIVIFLWAVFMIYLAVFSYLADCYGPFASSALAGQSLIRNIAGTAFPLFTHQMYKALDYKWANTLFGFLALTMMPIPFVLFFYGPRIRSRSRFSRQVLEVQTQTQRV